MKEVKENDLKRESDLKEWGNIIIRFTNDRVVKSMDSVLDEINTIVEKLINSSKELPK